MERGTEPGRAVLQAAMDGDLDAIKEMAGVVADGGIWARALSLAAMEGRLDVCRWLVEDHGVDVNQRTFTGDTALVICASYGTPAVTRYLLDRGADPTLIGALWPPLHGATMNGQCEILELLLSTGIDVDHFDSVYGTALHVAANDGQHGPMNILLQHHADAGADVNKIDYIGVTYGLPGIMKCLLDAGANPNIHDEVPGS